MACPGQFASWRALGREATRLCEPSAQGRPPLLGCCPVHPALADEQSNEVPGDHHHRPASHAVVDVRPGDQDAATTVEAWLQDYATSGDPQLRERIILAYLGVADRLTRRFRDSRGTSAEDLVQTARAGVIAAIDRYDPGYGTPFVPYAVACVVGKLKCHLRDTSRRLQIARPLKDDPCGCAGQPMSCISAWVAHLQPRSWPSSWTWTKRRSWTGWRPGQPP